MLDMKIKLIANKLGMMKNDEFSLPSSTNRKENSSVDSLEDLVAGFGNKVFQNM